MATSRRAYSMVRDLVEKWGGTMHYQKAGFRHGAWIISLNGKTATIEALGNRTLRALDELYVPNKPDPKTWDDYHADQLVPDAESKLLALLK